LKLVAEKEKTARSSMSLYVAPHPYQTRFQAKQKQSVRTTYLKKMSHLNLLYTIAQTTNYEERISGLIEVYRYLQEFQPWKISACMRMLLQKQIRHLLDNEIPTEIARMSAHPKDRNTDGILFDLFELESTVMHLEQLMNL
jgi:hypothetical protein